MSKYKFSPETKSFYPISFISEYEKNGSLPSDVVDVSNEKYEEFSCEPPKGKMRGNLSSGQPCWVNIPDLTCDEKIKKNSILRVKYINSASEMIFPLQDAIDLGIATLDEELKLTAWKKYRVLLSRIDTSKTLDIQWPDAPESLDSYEI